MINGLSAEVRGQHLAGHRNAAIPKLVLANTSCARLSARAARARLTGIFPFGSDLSAEVRGQHLAGHRNAATPKLVLANTACARLSARAASAGLAGRFPCGSRARSA